MDEFPARLHVLLARDSPMAVVIRRGPSKQVATLSWNRESDRFSLGQWMKGRIYERRSDISPDGKHLIYFALNGKWTSETRGSWTAISIAPYLRAKTIYAQGDAWNGGGLWLANNRYWLNQSFGTNLLRDDGQFRRDTGYVPFGSYGSECLSVYYPRLLRDGWSIADLAKADSRQHHSFVKPIHSDWILRKDTFAGYSQSGRGCYWDEHSIVNEKSGLTLAFPNWEWAEIDDNRLVWASEGKLFAGTVSIEGLRDEAMLYDFNSMKFQAVEAPY
ncbi:hypothetical protein [Calycomorphotria hydatis]|uniref:Uncharacterized protein n=1 Tax=Calycomorphotria hydatis TaxID=2528027 RepID=A0A517T3W9_9PLAN|nr:hypothetical protein [Calycomorphotria hydatis]QDT63065.1 hypothetical protein V22_02640 [Calycomorphotria hydatis]